jgi:chromosome segregation ATPase
VTTHLRDQLAGFLFLAMVFGSVGCASHGELVTLREELQTSLSQTRAYLNERIDKAADQLQAAETIQHRLKELQTVQQRQQATLSELKQEVAKLDALQTAVKELKGQPEVLKRAIEELKAKTDLLSQELGRLHGSVRVWNDRFLQSLRTEQEELRHRLKTVDRSLHDLEAAGVPHHTKTAVPQDRETVRH